jgi:CheY-like chemotaxis protein
MIDYLGKAKILIVDDFSEFRLTMKSMLVRLGGRHIDQASNGIQAVKQCTELRYDIIFCDYNLGEGQDGRQILEELHKRNLVAPDTLFLMVTAETTNSQVMGAIEYQPDAYLTKPFTGEQLGLRLNRLIKINRVLKPVHQAIKANQPEQAAKACDDVIAKYPKMRLSCLRIKTDLLESMGKYEAMLSLLAEVKSDQPVLWAELGIGKALFFLGLLENAKEQFIKTRQQFPKQVSPIDWQAGCEKSLGNKKETLSLLKDAIGISPKSVSRQTNLAEVAVGLSEFKTAQKAYSRTIREGTHSCLLEPAHFKNYYDNTREVTAELRGREKSQLMSEVESIGKSMNRRYEKDPTAMAANLSSMASLYQAVGDSKKASDSLSRLSKTLANPNCKINVEEFKYIQERISDFKDDQIFAKSMGTITQNLDSISESFEIPVVFDSNSRVNISSEETVANNRARSKEVNKVGLDFVNNSRGKDALENFLEAMELDPLNLIYPLNAVQVILSTDLLKSDPNTIKQCYQLMALLENMDKKDKSWKRYQTLQARMNRG